MKCPFCAQANASDAVFCTACGKKIPRCPGCGTVLYQRSRFCENDGAPLPEELFVDFPPEPAAASAVRPAAAAPPKAAGQAAQPLERKKKSGFLAVIIALAVLLLAAVAAGGYFFLRGDLDFLFKEEEAYVPASSRDDEWDEPEEEPEDDPADGPEDSPEADSAEEPEDQNEPEDAPAAEPEHEPEENTASTSSIAPVSMDAVASVDASSYLTQSSLNLYHTPGRTLDGDLSTAWVEGADGDGIGESIAFTFDGVYLVSGMRIYAGYQKSEDLYGKNARPAVLTVRFSDGTEQSVTLQDVNGPQEIDFDVPAETSSVTLVIASVYPGSKYEDTVISEVSFY